MSESTMRIVILGKTGSGKSSLANTIFGKKLFKINETPSSGTRRCEAKTTTFNGKTISLVDTPGFFDTGRPEEEMKEEIMSCLDACAPGPHAFFILLKVGRYTVHEKDVIDKMQQYFSGVLKYSIVVFTHGDQLLEGQTIDRFVTQSKGLRELVKKCGDRYHVVDNKYWENNQGDAYRYNKDQVVKILETTEKMIKANRGKHYNVAEGSGFKKLMIISIAASAVIFGTIFVVKYYRTRSVSASLKW